MLYRIPNVYTYKKNYLDSNSNKIKILILGNSHSYCGLNPEFIQQNAFNAAYFAQTVNLDAEILDRYFNRFGSLKFILLPIDYVSLNNRLEYSSENYRIKYYIKEYGINFPKLYFTTINLLNNPFKLNLQRLWWTYIQRNTTDFISDPACNRLGYFKAPFKTADIEKSGKLLAQSQKENNKFLKDNLSVIEKIIFFAEKTK